ncbi:MAG: hypothetical protein LC792_00250, partial [Actinobacteria bacterium]|nr:hypothetical protein [Actinomycetota bacterium]
HDLVASVAAAIAAETEGNPFFIKEVLRHLLDEGRLLRGTDGRWTSDRPVAELGIPEGVREVIDRRLSRLSPNANKFLSAASVFDGDVHLRVVAMVSDLDEDSALDALDEALDAQLLQPAGGLDVYRFTQSLIRHTLANELSPSRRGRLHLRAARALLATAQGSPTPAAAGEIAAQFHRGRSLAGAEEGVDLAMIAAGQAGVAIGRAEGEAAAAEYLAGAALPWASAATISGPGTSPVKACAMPPMAATSPGPTCSSSTRSAATSGSRSIRASRSTRRNAGRRPPSSAPPGPTRRPSVASKPRSPREPRW